MNLDLSCGALTAPLSRDRFEYNIDSNLFCQRLTLTPHAPDDTLIEVNGQSLDAAPSWTSEHLELGENPVSIVLTAPNSGASSRYELTIVRAGRQEAKMKARPPGSNDLFGHIIAIDKDVVVAGAPYEDGAAGGVNPEPGSSILSDSGAAYVFVRNGVGQWAQEAYLKADSPRSGAHFGASVAVFGDLIAVGAIGNDPNQQPAPNAIAGAVYLFKRSGTTWTQVARFAADDTGSSDMFGYKVILTADKLLVTAPFESSAVSQSGAAYVFDRQGEKVQQVAKLKSSRPYSLAGWGIGLAYDGSTIAVGACWDNQTVRSGGTGSVFTQRNGTWEEQFLEPNMPTELATFGLSMAVLGDTLAVGAPRWGYYTRTPSGQVYMFKRTADGWRQTTILQAFVPRPSDFFGVQLVLTPTALIIGANGDSSGAGGFHADYNDDSTFGSGAIYLLERKGDELVNPTFIKAASPNREDAFGVAIGLSGDTLATGAPYDGTDNSGAIYILH
jgi:hypothetical protein